MLCLHLTRMGTGMTAEDAIITRSAYSMLFQIDSFLAEYLIVTEMRVVLAEPEHFLDPVLSARRRERPTLLRERPRTVECGGG